jgi:hypothetical protein
MATSISVASASDRVMLPRQLPTRALISSVAPMGNRVLQKPLGLPLRRQPRDHFRFHL